MTIDSLLHALNETSATLNKVTRLAESQHRTIEALKLEMLTMGRTFAEANKIVLAHDAKVTAENVDLAKQLVDAQANARTPEEATAQQATIDRAEQLQPTPPDAPTPPAQA